MRLQQTCSYIDHRRARRGRPTLILRDDAKADTYRHAGGVPRLVNAICCRSILYAVTGDITIHRLNRRRHRRPLRLALCAGHRHSRHGTGAWRCPTSDRGASWQLPLGNEMTLNNRDCDRCHRRQYLLVEGRRRANRNGATSKTKCANRDGSGVQDLLMTAANVVAFGIAADAADPAQLHAGYRREASI